MLRVLHLEDSENDQILVAEMLRAEGLACDFIVVKTENDFESSLKKNAFDLIISDFSLPSCDALKALEIAQKNSPRTPFIFFSGTIGEEVAVETLKKGAMDYVLKQRPQRLVGAVRNALRAAGERARLERVENELRQMEGRLRIVAAASNDVVWEWDIQADTLWLSENFRNVFGFPREKFSRLEDLQSLIHPDERDRIVGGMTRMMATGGRIWWSEHRLRRANDSYLHVYDRASVAYDNSGKPLRMVGMIIDMTERKKAEEKIREQAELLDKAQDAIIVCDLDRTIVYWNKGAEQIYGWKAEEAIGKNVRALFFHGAMSHQMEEAVKVLERTGEWTGELSEFTKNDQPVIVQARATLIRDERGHPKSLLIINTDITERKQLEEQFLRAQRLESLGALVGGIAHDLNNALVPILVGVDILKGENLSSDAHGMVQTMGTSARRSAEMVRQMLLFARGGEADKTTVHLPALVKEMCRIISDTFPKSIRCQTDVEKNVRPVLGVPTQLHQVLLNLCVNARDAMPKGGTLTLTVKNAVVNAADALRQLVEPGRYVCISVKDDGQGIPPEALGKIFQPFFTTKSQDKGTGLGLSTCRSIVKNHGGFISVSSKPGEGAEFKVYLPASDAKSDTTFVPRAVLPGGNGERILVVDDEESILAITRAALQNFGYEVLIAGNGVEAVTIFSKNSDSIKLVISDLAMPLMGGRETIQELRKIKPGLKVIIASGTDGELEEALPHMKTDGVIHKPFTNEKLLETVHQVLTTK